MSNLRVSYQGAPGAFGQEAIAREWNGAAEAVPARTFHDAIELALNGQADLALIPSWNSAIGSIVAAAEAMGAYAGSTVVQGEVILPVKHHLLALPGASMESIRWVGSHPVALAQCSRLFQEKPHLTPVHSFDTAGAAQELALAGASPAALYIHSAPASTQPAACHTTHAAGTDRGHTATGSWLDHLQHVPHESLAVLASATAADVYGLNVLAAGVQDDPGNETCFLILAPGRTTTSSSNRDTLVRGGLASTSLPIGIGSAVSAPFLPGDVAALHNTNKVPA